jgi:hypothetical protein
MTFGYGRIEIVAALVNYTTLILVRSYPRSRSCRNETLPRCREWARSHSRCYDTAVYGDKGYASDAKRGAAEEAGALWAVKKKAKPGRDSMKRQRARNRVKMLKTRNQIK